MNYHVWVIVNQFHIRLANDEFIEKTNVDPWKRINDKMRWLVNQFGLPTHALNTYNDSDGVWQLSIHCVEQDKIHYKISFKNEEDAALFKITWL